ncbi:MAG: response regulator [Bacteriovoracaceae bacterium]|nr:response regulator [Bacteriovoracaceae bacterium]
MTKKIIAVEDSPNLQKILKLIFSETEFEFDLCENYEQLTQLYRMSDFHLLLLDFSISSNIDGYSLCRSIKKDYPGLKIILMFGTFDSPDKEKLNYAGADDHIYKPFDSEKLLKLCQKMTSESKSSSLVSPQSKKTERFKNDSSLPEIFLTDLTDDASSWGNIDVPSVISGSNPHRWENQETPAPQVMAVEEKFDTHTEYLVSSQDTLLERTEVIDLESKRKSENQNIQKINQIIGREKIEDLWTFDEMSNEKNLKSPSKSHSTVTKEQYFEQVDQEVLKKELMAEFKRTLIFEIKEEVFKQLWNSLKQEFMDKKSTLIENVAKDVVKEIKSSISERSIKDEIINSIESKLSDKVKEELPGVLSQTIETLASRVAQSSLEKKMAALLPDLAEDLIKKDLASIRKLIM